MAQSVNLSVSGIYTSISDYNGLPQGALDVADNVESRYKNVLEPRRGFESLPNAAMTGIHFVRLTNFFINGTSRIIGLTSDGDIRFYTGANPWPLVPGDYSEDIENPNDLNSKSRFIQVGQNLYVTAKDGVRSLASGPTAQMIRAGVPKGLNLQAETNGDTSGFFSNNTQVVTVGSITASSPLISNIDDLSGIQVGQYVSGTNIPSNTTVTAITEAATVLVEEGNTTAGSTTLSSIAGTGSLSTGMLISGTGIQEGTKISGLPGGSNVTMSLAAFQSTTGSFITFSSAPTITMSNNATATQPTGTLTFYSGSQVGYRLVFGRVETDINGNTITRLGAASSIAIANNTLGTDTNVSITGALPKNSENEITFMRLYRSPQTESISISPLDQYNLVFERLLTSSDFAARIVTITDNVPNSLVGIPLYSGSDQEGVLQGNEQPPLSWDMGKFRDFVLYGNITRPTTSKLTIVSVGAPSGVQLGDQINISGTFLTTTFSQNYIAVTGGENAPNRQFQLFTSGTPSQNIADTANSLIRVINYDNAVPVHALLLSTTTDLPGQILLEADYPTYDTFFVNASANKDAYDPTLDHIESEINNLNNAVAISKIGEFEAVPSLNFKLAGDTSSDIVRIIPLRDYVIILKTDGIYKGQGTSPQSFIISPFDLTTKIIGAETAVPLNSEVWMLSNQGVVSISDGGVSAKSIPIDDQLNRLIGSYLNNLTDRSFAIGYESDRKYILSVPESDQPYTEIQYGYNYNTTSWTTWSRDLFSGFIHSTENKLYIARANTQTGADPQARGVSKERKTATYTDYVDEGLENVIVSVNGDQIVLNDIATIEVGDILYQSYTLFSPIVEINTLTNTVTTQYELSFTAGACDILKSFQTTIAWKQVFGDNPAFMRQFSEGIVLFKNTRFNLATMKFVTDFSQNDAEVELFGTGIGLWGLFPWGDLPWGGAVLPDKIRFLIPQEKQLGSYIIPTLQIKQGYSDFKMQGMSISYYNVSQEVGK